jgi:hypothetical protein
LRGLYDQRLASSGTLAPSPLPSTNTWAAPQVPRTPAHACHHLERAKCRPGEHGRRSHGGDRAQGAHLLGHSLGAGGLHRDVPPFGPPRTVGVVSPEPHETLHLCHQRMVFALWLAPHTSPTPSAWYRRTGRWVVLPCGPRVASCVKVAGCRAAVSQELSGKGRQSVDDAERGGRRRRRTNSTLSPGWKRVPRWRHRMWPGSTCSPENFFTPSRFDSLSRPARALVVMACLGVTVSVNMRPCVDAPTAQLRSHARVAAFTDTGTQTQWSSLRQPTRGAEAPHALSAAPSGNSSAHRSSPAAAWALFNQQQC